MVELIHMATLIHDDSIDRSLLRRGLPTINTLWSDRVSVILGDYLYTRAFDTMVAARNWDVVSVLSRTAHQMTIGEILGVEQKNNLEVEEKEYLRLISEKTASLFSASCEIGAVLSGEDRNEYERFRDFGQQLGMAFQIADDLFDYLGDADVLGKAIASDLTEGKITLPVIHGLREAPTAVRPKVEEILKAGQADADGWKDLTATLDEVGSFDYCRKRADEYAGRAEARIDDCPDGVYKATLATTIKFATQRCH
jgi:octaprenyl-diphosphate synthase